MRLTRTALLKSIRSLALRGDEAFRPVYVCGVAGCGNTLLATLLHERFAVAGFADESALYAPARSPFAIRSSRSYPSIAAFRAAMTVDDAISPPSLRSALAAQYRRETDLPKCGEVMIDKAPNTHMVRARALHAAYPAGRFVLIFRDPVSHVEGLRRKWPLFGAAPLHEVCGFWRDLHETFLADTRDFRDRVRGYAYEDFVHRSDECLAELGSWLELARRERPRVHRDRANRPGYALRNVVGGKVRVVEDANAAALARLAAAERETIRESLMPLYTRLKEEFGYMEAVA
jgi:hypothetical protein